jgi:RNA polymerase sigma-70 factor (ECF subfamily)
MKNLETLYARYARDVYRFALYLSRDPTRAEDIVSETFVRALLGRGEIRVATVKAYLFTIARNLYRNQRRSAGRAGVEVADLMEALPDPAASPEARLDQQRRLRTALEALESLPEGDRTALLMRAEEGMAYADIAAVLGSSAAAVRVRVHRARLRLAELCGEGGDHEHHS